MNIRSLLAATCVGALLCGCALSPEQPEEPDYELHRDGDHIVYRGSLYGQPVKEVSALLATHGEAIEWLDIESPGGEVMSGLALGELVLHHDLGVRVIGDGCHSSCANYVFTAGRQKVIAEGAVVTWHGSALQQRWSNTSSMRPSERSALREFIREWKALQKGFFERTGIDERITIVGQDLRCRCTWALSAKDMARFGLHAKVPESYTDTDMPEGSDGSRAKFLELPDDVMTRIRPRDED